MSQTMQQTLDENIPRDVISTRSGGGNKQLSYLETWYVIDRLNQVLGTANWSNELVRLQLLPGEGRPSYMAIVRIVANIDGVRTLKDGVGYGSDKSDHNAHELAMKEACSDAFKVAAKNMGRSLGLALYDKSQEFVGNSTTTNNNAISTNSLESATTTNTKVAGPDPRSIIKAQFKALKAAKKTTPEQFKEKYLAGGRVDELTDDQAATTLAALRTEHPDLIV